MSKKKLTPTRLFVAAFLLCFSITLQAQAAPGDLDATFGNGGRVSLTNFLGQAMAVQSDGKIVVAGYRRNDPNSPGGVVTLVRYKTDGSLDPTFGTGGIVSIPPDGVSGVNANAVAIQSDGKILTAGGGYTVNQMKEYAFGIGVARYNADGSLDTSFGTGGKVVTIFFYECSVDAVAIQSDGKIVTAGYHRGSTSWDFLVLRYNKVGVLDPSFGDGGKVLTPFGGYIDEAKDVAIQADGKIVAAGRNRNNLNYPYDTKFALARYNTNGSLDASFGTGGKVVTPFGSNSLGAYDVVVQSDGKIVATGSGGDSPNNFALARYNSEGALDPSFGSGGKVSTSIGSSEAYAAALQPDGRIVAAGVGSDGANSGVALAKYYIDGSLDTSFGTGGKVVTPFPGGGAADAVAIQSDGKIVVLGSRWNSSTEYEFALFRYLNNPRRTLFDFDGDGRADVAVFRPTDRVWYLLRSSSGFTAAQFGNSTDKLVPADFDGDGKTDIAVFRDGFWYWLNSSNGSFQSVQFGQAGDVPVPADFTGDGRAELAVYRAGFWYTLNLASNQFQAVQFGISTDKPVPADFDGDGKTDIAVYREGTWYLLRSSQGFTAIQFGLSTDKPTVGDYDGDGKADQAVYRGGVWYVLASTQGFSAVQFGCASDIPVPADYDGDGKTDIAVFRNGAWFLQRSSQGFTDVAFGEPADQPIPNAFVP